MVQLCWIGAKNIRAQRVATDAGRGLNRQDAGRWHPAGFDPAMNCRGFYADRAC